MTLGQHIDRYLALVARADSMFSTVASQHAGLIRCRQGCDDCCSVYYELSLIEAFVISHSFRNELEDNVRDRVLAKARLLEPRFREAAEMLASVAGTGPEDSPKLLDSASRLIIQCPLNERGGCAMYEHRAITCRLYGVPQKIAGRVVPCPKSGFAQGQSYATVDVDALQSMLQEYSREFLSDMLGIDVSKTEVPRFFMSTTLLTDFNKAFFVGLGDRLRCRP